MPLLHKSFVKSGTLDNKIYEILRNTKTRKTYYFYVIDLIEAFVHLHRRSFDKKLFHSKSNRENTWNYDLKIESLNKNHIMNESVKFGFGDYRITDEDDKILVKGQDHFYTKHKGYAAHIIDKKEKESYSTDVFSFQKVLKKEKNRELNIYVVRDLDSREIYFFPVYITVKMKHINRKKDEVVSTEAVDLKKELGGKYEGFCEYMNDISFDYGRIELIKDEILGWCVIDINNSPGGGILTEKYHRQIAKIFKKTII